MPAISVILPCYNTERYIATAVNSILVQTFSDFEFIIIDDGSTDGSPQILREFASKDSRIRLVSRPNKGLTRTLNEAIGMAAAPLLARMDGDDVSGPERFEKQVAYLNAHAECVCLGSRVQLIDPYDSPLGVTDHKLTHEEIDADLLKGIGWSIVHPTAMMRSDAVKKVGGYRDQFDNSEDLDLFLRLAEVGKLANLPEALVKYRRHPQSVNHLKYENQWKLKKVIVAEAYERRGMEMPADWTFNKWKPKEPAEQLRDWAWAALKIGNKEVARKHAKELLKKRPMSVESWRVMYCAMRGR